MDASNPKLSSDDEDYWHHDDRDIPWNDGCRINHDQPTWYFSFMGRRGRMIEWTKAKKGGGGGGGRGGRRGNGRGGHHGAGRVETD